MRLGVPIVFGTSASIRFLEKKEDNSFFIYLKAGATYPEGISSDPISIKNSAI
jgi:hypothetical protein